MAVLRAGDALRLEIDLLWQGQDLKGHQVMAAHIPMLLQPEAKQVAVIGLGTGQTCSRFFMYDIQRLDCVEIEHGLIDLVRRHFDSSWMEDARLRFIIEDGRNYLTHTRSAYDVISLEVGQIFRPGLAAFYTLEFYEAARSRLKPGGILCQFVPLVAFRPDEFLTIVHTFLQAFPNSILWYNTSELLIIGKRAEQWQLAPSQLERLNADDAAWQDMRFAYWGGPEYMLNRPEVFWGGFLAGPAGLARMAKDARSYRDDRPFLEYSTCKSPERSEIAILEVLREGLEPCAVILSPPPEPGLARAAAAVQEANLGDIRAAAFVRSSLELPANDLSAQLEHLDAALRWNPKNVQANLLRGDVLLIAGRKAEAVESFFAAVGADPSSARARQQLGGSLYMLGRYAEAAEHLRVSIQLEPGNADTHNMLGAALAVQNDLEGAVQHFAEAVRLRPDDPNPRANLDRARNSLRQHDGERSH
jgi:spermidine synthase